MSKKATLSQKERKNIWGVVLSAVIFGGVMALSRSYRDEYEDTDVKDIDFTEIVENPLDSMSGYAYSLVPTPVYRTVSSDQDIFLTELPPDTLIGTPTGQRRDGYVQLSIKFNEIKYSYWAKDGHIKIDPKLDSSKALSSRYVQEIITKY